MFEAFVAKLQSSETLNWMDYSNRHVALSDLNQSIGFSSCLVVAVVLGVILKGAAPQWFLACHAISASLSDVQFLSQK